jgi:diphthine-ammonia ligase
MCALTNLTEFSSINSDFVRCQRLSLITLSYLWQRDQDELLSEMIDSGLEAIIIKVAGVGLSVKHLGKTLQEMQPTLRRLVSILPCSILCC